MRRLLCYLLLIGIIFLSNCTSQKQYKKSLSEIEQYKKQVQRLKLDSMELANQADELTLMLGNERKEKEQVIAETEELQNLKDQVKFQNDELHILKAAILNSLVYFEMDDLELYVKHGKVYISLSDKLLFNSGSDIIEMEGIDILQHIADVLKHHSNIHILVEGHTDNIPVNKNHPKFKDNWELSTARAASVARLLCGPYELSPERVSVIGRGEYSPKASNDSEEGRRKNRRTEIILSPKLEDLLNTVVYGNETNDKVNKEVSYITKSEEPQITYTSPRIFNKEGGEKVLEINVVKINKEKELIEANESVLQITRFWIIQFYNWVGWQITQLFNHPIINIFSERIQSSWAIQV